MINKIIYYSIMAIAAVLCIGAAIVSDICNGIASLFKEDGQQK